MRHQFSKYAVLDFVAPIVAAIAAIFVSLTYVAGRMRGVNMPTCFFGVCTAGIGTLGILEASLDLAAEH